MQADPLEQEVRRYIGLGFRVTSRTDGSAQLVRPKTFNFVAACLWFLLFGVGVFVYVAYYLSKQDEVVYLSAEFDGQIARQGSGSVLAGALCKACGYENRQPRTHCKRCKAPLLRTA